MSVLSRSRVRESDLRAVREAFDRESGPPLNGSYEGPEFIELALTTFDPNDGSEQGVLDFIENCNSLGFTAKQVSKASWVRHDHLSEKARQEEKARLDKCGSSAEELWGSFNPNPAHNERITR